MPIRMQECGDVFRHSALAPGHIEDDGDSSQRVLEVGSEAIAVKRVPISEHFYASEVGVHPLDVELLLHPVCCFLRINQ